MNRYALLFLGFFAACVGYAALRPAPRPVRTLKDYALQIGTAVDPTLLRGDPKYRDMIVDNASFVEGENAFKWYVLHTRKGAYDFSEPDAVMSFAAKNGKPVRACCLVWRLGVPKWLGSPDLTPKMGEILHEHISTVAGRYRGKVAAWDVVNEAFALDGSLVHSHWYDWPGIGVGPGTAYIEKAFLWTKEADPEAKLFYNDFAAEEINAKSDGIYRMVADFKRRGIPIDGVGFQAHVPLAGIDYDSFRRNMARFVALGVEVQLTELDVAVPKHALFAGMRQAKVFRNMVGACLDIPGCTAVQLWGLDDRNSWIPGNTGGAFGDATLFDKAYRPKSAYFAVLNELGSRQ